MLKDTKDKFFIKEKNHNYFSVLFFFILFLIYFTIFLEATFHNVLPLMIAAGIAMFLCLIKFIYQINWIINFKKLIKSISQENLVFYITKS